MIISCAICSRELTNDISVIRGIGPICRAKVLSKIEGQKSKVCDYDVEFYNAEKIVIIHELTHPDNPKISLTNCVEFVIREIVSNYKLCPGIWAFVEHPSIEKSLFGQVVEYDLVSIDGESVIWRYLYHNEAKDEKQSFSKELIADRVKAYRRGEKSVLNKVIANELEVLV